MADDSHDRTSEGIAVSQASAVVDLDEASEERPQQLRIAFRRGRLGELAQHRVAREREGLFVGIDVGEQPTDLAHHRGRLVREQIEGAIATLCEIRGALIEVGEPALEDPSIASRLAAVSPAVDELLVLHELVDVSTPERRDKAGVAVESVAARIAVLRVRADDPLDALLPTAEHDRPIRRIALVDAQTAHEDAGELVLVLVLHASEAQVQLLGDRVELGLTLGRADAGDDVRAILDDERRADACLPCSRVDGARPCSDVAVCFPGEHAALHLGDDPDAVGVGDELVPALEKPERRLVRGRRSALAPPFVGTVHSAADPAALALGRAELVIDVLPVAIVVEIDRAVPAPVQRDKADAVSTQLPQHQESVGRVAGEPVEGVDDDRVGLGELELVDHARELGAAGD